MKNYKVYFLVPLTLLILILIFPFESLAGAKEGVYIWQNNILPTLLPFAIGASMLQSSGFPYALGNLFSPVLRLLKLPREVGGIWFLSWLCGYPMGSKLCANMYEDGLLHEKDYAHVLALCSSCSPIFIVSTLSAQMLDNASLALPIFISHYSAVLIVAFFTSFFKKDQKTAQENKRKHIQNKDFAKALSNSLKDPIESQLTILSTVVLFGVVGNILKQILPDNISLVVTTLLEMSKGCINISSLSYISTTQRAALSTALISFGGVAILAQIIALTKNPKQVVLPFLISKAFTALISYFIANAIIPYMIKTPAPVFAQERFKYNSINFSTYFSWICVFICLISFIYYNAKQRNNTNKS